MSLEDKIASIVEPYIKTGYSIGVCVGVVRGDIADTFCFGVRDLDSATPCDADTQFEIGSITKLFTANLLQEMTSRGEADPTDALDAYLPDGVKAPSYRGEKIRLVNLATHSSSLPRLPKNLFKTTKLAGDPYADYSEQDLLEAVRSTRLRRPIGQFAVYSNFGAGLLGYVLSRRLGISYEQALTERILRPIGMEDTSIIPTEEQASRMAQGHKITGMPANDLHFSVLAGAGGLRSSVRDMVKYVSANLNRPTSLQSVLQKCHEPVPNLALNRSGWIDYAAYGLLALACLVLQRFVPVEPGTLLFLLLFALPFLTAAIYAGLEAWLFAATLMLLGTYLLWPVRFDPAAGILLAGLVGMFTYWFQPPALRNNVALGWQQVDYRGERLLWHNGMTSGFSAYLGILRESGVGVVVLSNRVPMVDSLGIDILHYLQDEAKTSSKAA